MKYFLYCFIDNVINKFIFESVIQIKKSIHIKYIILLTWLSWIVVQLQYSLGPLLLKWFNFNPSITSIIKCGMKLLIHS